MANEVGLIGEENGHSYEETAPHPGRHFSLQTVGTGGGCVNIAVTRYPDNHPGRQMYARTPLKSGVIYASKRGPICCHRARRNKTHRLERLTTSIVGHGSELYFSEVDIIPQPMPHQHTCQLAWKEPPPRALLGWRETTNACTPKLQGSNVPCRDCAFYTCTYSSAHLQNMKPGPESLRLLHGILSPPTLAPAPSLSVPNQAL